MQQEIITAIDFGTYKFSASAAIKDDDGEMQILNTVSVRSVGMEKGLISDAYICRDAVKNLLTELEKKIKRNVERVSIGISSRKLRLTEKTVDIEVSENKITRESILEALKKCRDAAELSDEECIVDEIINYYIVDDNVILGEVESINCNTAKININLVIGLKSEIEKYYKVFEDTKYILSDIKSNILCGKQIFLSDSADIQGDCAIVDVGAGKVDIAVFDKNGIPNYISSIPVGGNNISNDLSICGEVSFLEADNMKKRYSSNYKSVCEDKSISEEIEIGNVKVSKDLFYEVINARIEEILNHINNELKKTGHLSRICSIILYGDGVSYFEGINKIANKIFKVKTKVITGVDLGIKNSENITSMALAKEVYDRLNLLGDNTIVTVNKNVEEQHQVNKTESLHYNEDGNQVLKKLKNLFNKIF